MEKQKVFYVRKENEKECHAIPIPENTLEYRQQCQEALLEYIEEKKNSFQKMIDRIRALMHNALLSRSVYGLDETRKKELEECQKKWEQLMSVIDYVEKEIKRNTNGLLKIFHGNENGEIYRIYTMINKIGFEDAVGYEEGFVPQALPIYLFTIIDLLNILSSCAMNAMSIQYDVNTIFENNPQKIEELFKKNLKLVSDDFLDLKRLLELIKKTQEKNQRQSAIQSDRSIRKLSKIENKVDKRNKADKRKSLTQEECAVILFKQKGIYFMKRQNYLHRVGITKTKAKFPKNDTMVLRTIQRWDQYLATNGEKGSKPPKGYSREKSQMEFEIWAEDLEKQKYLRWENRQPLIMLKKKKPDETEEALEEEDDIETRGREDMVEMLKRLGVK